MICNNCNGKDECDWYSAYKQIEDCIHYGIGTDEDLGRALLSALQDNPLTECEYFE